MATPAKTGRVETNPETGFQSHHGQAIGFDDLQGPASSAKNPPSQAPTWTDWNFGIGGGVEFEVQSWGVGDSKW